MSFELPPRPGYPFPDTTQDPSLINKIVGYIDAVQGRNAAAESAGWEGTGSYFAGQTIVEFHRSANRITVDPEEAKERLDLLDDDGEVRSGFVLTVAEGLLSIRYCGATDDRYFETMERLIEWGEELSNREENATIHERFTHTLRRIGLIGVKNSQ